MASLISSSVTCATRHASGELARSGVQAKCLSEFDNLGCVCDCLYTDDGCYLSSSSSGEAGSDTGSAR